MKWPINAVGWTAVAALTAYAIGTLATQAILWIIERDSRRLDLKRLADVSR